MPVVQQKLDEEWQGKKIGVFGISSGDPEFYARGFKEEMGVDFPFLIDDYYEDSQLCKDYGIDDLPMIDFWSVFVLDSEGVIRFAGKGQGNINYTTAWGVIDGLTETPEDENAM